VAGIVRGATGSEIVGSVAQYGIIVFAAFAALTQLGIAPELIAPTFLILLGAVALAAAIAFGLGGQHVAQEMVQNAYEKGDEAKQNIQQQSESGSAGGAEGNDMPAFRRQ
jgi:NAD/NADP transhydrogenase alpha subunit